MSASGVCLRLVVPQTALPFFETALELLGGAQAAELPDAQGQVALALYLEAPPDAGLLDQQLGLAAEVAGIDLPAHAIESLPDVDWVAESQKALPPIAAGRFYLHGSHDSPPAGGGQLVLQVEAGAAFGTGRHESTRGCLLALSRIAKSRRADRVLDMGCGSGVLAMAAARLWRTRIVGVDNDPVSVRVARENARVNDLGQAGLRFVAGDGYRPPLLRRAGPFDLILANILAPPLITMAGDLARHLAPGGRAVLAGLLITQERAVLARHRNFGLVLDRRLHLGEWSILTLKKKRGKTKGGGGSLEPPPLF